MDSQKHLERELARAERDLASVNQRIVEYYEGIHDEIRQKEAGLCRVDALLHVDESSLGV